MVFFKMKHLYFLLLCFCFAIFTVLGKKFVQNQELVDVKSWSDFRNVDLVSVNAVAEDCEKIFQSHKNDVQKVVDALKEVIQKEDDASTVPPKIWNSLTQITSILQNATKKVKNQFSEIGEHFLKRLDTAISIGKFKKSDYFEELQNIYNRDIESTNALVISSEKVFTKAYNPTQIFQQTLRQSLNKKSYSSSTAEDELNQLQLAISEEFNNIESTSITLLNQIYKGITVAKTLQTSLRKNGSYPDYWSADYVHKILQNCCYIAKTVNSSGEVKNTDSEVDTNTKQIVFHDDSNNSGENNSADQEDHQGCGEIFRKTEKKIMRALAIAKKEIKSVKDIKEIDSRMFRILKSYSVILSNLNHKVVTSVITVVNQFFTLYNVILSILSKINPKMREKVNAILYITDIDSDDLYCANINKYIVGNYLSTIKMDEFDKKIDADIKTMKSLAEMKGAIIQELNLSTKELGKDLKIMKETILYIFQMIQKGIAALQIIKNKSNVMGWRYYVNFYKAKSELEELKQLMYVINAINIDLLVERELINDNEELQHFGSVTQITREEIDKENQKVLDKLNYISDYSFAEGFVSQSTLEYNLILRKYSSESRETLKRVITKYITIYEEVIIILKRKRIKNLDSLENVFNKHELSETVRDTIISQYLLENSEIDISNLCTSSSQANVKHDKDMVVREINELNQVTSQEVNKISECVKNTIDKMAQHIKALKTIKDQSSKTTNYEITQDQLNCIKSIIQIIDSLQIRSNTDEMQNLSIYFDRIIDEIQSAVKQYETISTRVSDIAKLTAEVKNTELSIYNSLSKASVEVKKKITRYVFEFNEVWTSLIKYTKINSLKKLDSEEIDASFTLSETTKKCITGSYNLLEIFNRVNDVIATNDQDISKLRTDVSTKLDETIEKIESEIGVIQKELCAFAQNLAVGIKIMEKITSKKLLQVEETDISKLQDINNMVKIFSKYMVISNENSKREIQVQVDTTRMQISEQCDNINEVVKSLFNEAEIETSVLETVENSDAIYNELNSRALDEMNENVDEFFASMKEKVDVVRGKNAEITVLRDIFNERNYQIVEDSEYEKFSSIMISQNFRSVTTVSDIFNELKVKNSVDSKTIKEKSTQIFQSLSDKIGLNINNVSFVSKYLTKHLEEGNKILAKLEKGDLIESTKALKQEEIVKLKKIVTIARMWQTGCQNKVVREIETDINKARTEIGNKLTEVNSNVASLNDEKSVQTEVQNSLRFTQNIYDSVQQSVTNQIKSSTSEFYDRAVNLIKDADNVENETARSVIQSIIDESVENIESELNNKNLLETWNSDCFTTKLNTKKIFNQFKITLAADKTFNMRQTTTNYLKQFDEKINQDLLSIQTTTKYVLQNIQKGYDILSEVQNSKEFDLELSATQLNDLRLCKLIYQKMQTADLSLTENEESNIIDDINDTKTLIEAEYTKLVDSIKSTSDENTIREIQIKGIHKLDQLYSELNEKVKIELSTISSNFYIKFERDMRQSKIAQNILNGKYYSEDQTSRDVSSFLNSETFKSSITVQNLFQEIQSTFTQTSDVSQRSLEELNMLNDRLNQAIEGLKKSSKYILDVTRTSSEVLNQVEESIKQDINYQFSENEISELQKFVTTYVTLQSVSNVDSTIISKTQETIKSDINSVRELFNQEYSQITNSLSTNANVQVVVAEKITKLDQLYVQTREKVQRQLSKVVNGIYTNFAQITYDLEKQSRSEMSVSMQNILTEKVVYGVENDQIFDKTVSFLSSESFRSNTVVRHLYNNIQSNVSADLSTSSQRATNELNILNEYTTQSLNEFAESSSNTLQMVQKSSTILNNIKQSLSQKTIYQLTEEELIELQKYVTIYHSLKTSSIKSSTIINTKNIIHSDINSLRNSIKAQYTMVTSSLISGSDINEIKRIETESVAKVDQLYVQKKQKLQSQLLQMAHSVLNSYEQISTDLQRQSTIEKKSLLQEILSGRISYQEEDDQSLQSMISLVNNESFKSSVTIKNWFKEVRTTSEENLTSEIAIKELTLLNERIDKSLTSWEESSAYILEATYKSVTVLMNVQESLRMNVNHELSEEEIRELQRSVAVYQTVINTSTNINSVTISNVQKSIDVDINMLKTSIENELKINSSKQESVEVVDNLNQFYSLTKEKIQTQISQISSTFYNSFDQIIFDSKLQTGYESKSYLQNILNSKDTFEAENDQTFMELNTYLNSYDFKSTKLVFSWYEESRSSGQTVAQLKDRVIQSTDKLQSHSQYILETLKNGVQIMQQIRDTTSDIKLSSEQVSVLQKCISITQTVKTVTTNISCTSLTRVQQTIMSKVSSLKNQLNAEYTKTSSALQTITEETAVKQVASESVSKFEQLYSETKDKVQSQLSQITSTFYNNFEQISMESEIQFQSTSTSVLRNVINSREIYDSEEDQSYIDVVSYFKSTSFVSSNVRTWFQEIESLTTSVAVNEKVSNELNTLNERVFESVEQLETNSQYVLSTFKSGLQVMKQIRELSISNTNVELTNEQIMELQKCMSLIQVVRTATTIVSSTSLINIQQTITSDLTTLKNEINLEYSETSNILKTTTEETKAKEIVSCSVKKLGQFYSKTQNKIQSQLSQITSTFYNNFEQISSESVTQTSGEVLRNVLNSRESYDVEEDQSFFEVLSYFRGTEFTSYNLIQNWYREMKSTTVVETSSQMSITDLTALNERVSQSIVQMETTSKYVLDTLKSGVQVMKQICESSKSSTNIELTKEQITTLQKCVTLIQIIETVTTRISSTNVASVQKSLSSDFSTLKNQFSSEYSKATNTLGTVTEETSVKQIAFETVYKYERYYSKTQNTVQSQLSQVTSTLLSNFEQITTDIQTRTRTKSKSLSSLQNIMNSRETYEGEEDQSYIEVISFFKSTTFKSSSFIQSWYKEIESQTNGEIINEKVTTELSTLNDRITQTVEQMETNSQYALDTLKSGIQIMKQVRESSMSNTNIELTDEQIIELQKCVSLIQIIKTVTTNISSSNVKNVQQTISSDISTLKTQLNAEYSKTTNILNTVSEETKVKQIVSESVTKCSKFYSETKSKVRSELSQITSTFFSNFEQITEETSSQFRDSSSTNLRHILDSREAYDMEEDQSFFDVMSYFMSTKFTSSNYVQEFYKIESVTTGETLNKKVTMELNNLNQRVSESVDELEINSKYVLDTIKSGIQVVKQIRESLKGGADIKLTQEQIITLQKCVTIIQTIKTTTTRVTSTSVATVQKSLTSEFTSLKDQLNVEYSNAASSLNLATDETSVKQIASETVTKYEQHYSQTKNKLQTQLSQITSTLLNNFEQITTETRTQSTSNSVLQKIFNSRETYEIEENQSYVDVISFFSSTNFKSSNLIQNWYKEIQSQTSSETINEKVTTELSSLNERVTQSIEQMETNSQYALDTIKSGIQIIKQIRESSASNINIELTNEQIMELQKVMTLTQVIKTATTNVSSSNVKNVQRTISSDISNLKNRLNAEHFKTTNILRTVTEEAQVKQITSESIQKYGQFYSETKNRVSSELSQITDVFFRNFEQITEETSTHVQSETSSNLQQILDSNEAYDVEQDQSFFDVVSYYRSNNFSSYNSVLNWYSEIESITSSETTNKKVIIELDTLNERISQSMVQMENNSNFVLDTLKSGAQVMKQVRESSKLDTKIQLTQEQVIVLQKCVTLIKTIKTVTTRVSSTNVASIQKSLVSDFSTLKNQLSSEYSKVTSTLSTVTEEKAVKQIASETVSKYERYYSKTKYKVQSQLSQVTSTLLSNFEQITTDTQSQSTSILKSVLNSKDTYESDEDNSYADVVSFFKSTTFMSSDSVQNWYRDIESQATNSEAVNEKVITELNTLNDRIFQSVEQMETSSQYALDTIKSGIQIIKQVRESSISSANSELTKEQIKELQKCVSLTQVIKTVTTNISLTNVRNVQQTISSDISTMKNHLTLEYSKTINRLNTVSEEIQVKQIASESVTKYDNFYSETKNKVRSELSQITNTFFSSFELITEETSTHFQSEFSTLQNILNSREIYDFEDQSYVDVVSYLKSTKFMSSKDVKNWYKEIESAQTSEILNTKVTTELNILNQRVSRSVDELETNSKYVLDTIQSGTQVVKQIRESLKSNTKIQLTQEQITNLQKCVSIMKIIRNVSTTTSSTDIKNTQQTIISDVSILKTQFNSEYSKISTILDTVTDESEIKQIASETITKYVQQYSLTQNKVQFQLSEISSSFFSDFEQITSESSISVLQNVINSRDIYEADDDETYLDAVSFLKSPSFTSSTCIQSWYREIESTTMHEVLNEKVKTELGTLNERVSQSVDQMENNSKYVLDTIKTGVHVLKQVRESSSELTEEQVTELKKSISIVKVLKTVSTKVSSTSVTNIQKTITSDVSTLKNQLNVEYSKTTSLLNTLTEEESIKQVATESVSKYGQYYSETKKKVRSQLSDISSTFFNNFEQVTTESKTLESRSTLVLENILNAKECYEAEDDQDYEETISYLSSENFKSSNCVQNWFREIESTTTEGSLSQKVSTEFGTLNQRVTQSVDEMETNSNYVLNTVKSGVQILKYVRESTNHGTAAQLSEEQITELKRCISIIRLIKTVATNVSSTKVINIQRSISSDVSTLKNQLTSEYSKTVSVISSTTDETTIKQIASETVTKCEQHYSQTKNKVRSQLSEISSNFVNNLEEVTFDFKTQSKSLQNILNSRDICEADDDRSYIDAVSYLKSTSLTSVDSVKNWYSEIESSTTCDTLNEKVTSELSTLNERVYQSVDEMESNSKYVLDTIKTGTHILKQIRESSTELTEEQATELQKCVSIIRVLKTVTTKVSSTNVKNIEKSIISDVNSLKSELNAEYSKTSSILSTVEDEETIKQIATETVSKYEQYYSTTKNKVQSQLSEMSSSFLNNFKQVTSESATQKSELRQILDTSETYEAQDDQNYTEAFSYLKSFGFTSSNSVHKWFKEIESSTTNETTTQKVSTELDTLNQRVTESVDQMESNSKYILNAIKNGAQVLKQIRESNNSDKILQLSPDQVTELKKCISIIRTVKIIMTKVSSTAVTTTQQTISSEVNSLKSQLNSEHSKTITLINSASDENSVKQIASETVSKYEQRYSETKNKVRSQLSEISSTFFTDFEQIAVESETESESISVLRNIIEAKETYEEEKDQNYFEAISYLKSTSFTSSSCVQSWFKEAESTVTGETLNEKVMSELDTLNSRVTQSVDQMEYSSKYVLDTIKSGVQILKVVRESEKSATDVELSQEQIAELKKCMSIIQTVKSVTSNTSSETDFRKSSTFRAGAKNTSTKHFISASGTGVQQSIGEATSSISEVDVQKATSKDVNLIAEVNGQKTASENVVEKSTAQDIRSISELDVQKSVVEDVQKSTLQDINATSEVDVQNAVTKDVSSTPEIDVEKVTIKDFSSDTDSTFEVDDLKSTTNNISSTSEIDVQNATTKDVISTSDVDVQNATTRDVESISEVGVQNDKTKDVISTSEVDVQNDTIKDIISTSEVDVQNATTRDVELTSEVDVQNTTTKDVISTSEVDDLKTTSNSEIEVQNATTRDVESTSEVDVENATTKDVISTSEVDTQETTTQDISSTSIISKESIEAEVTELKNQLTIEFSENEKFISSLKDEASIKHATEESVNKCNLYYTKARDKVQTQLSHNSLNFYSNLEKMISDKNQQSDSEVKTILQDIFSQKDDLQIENDQEFTQVLTFLEDDDIESATSAQKWYDDVQSNTQSERSATLNQEAVTRLNTLNTRIVKSIDNLETQSKSILDVLQKGSEILKQVQESNSTYQLTEEEITIIKKCTIITKSIQMKHITTINTSNVYSDNYGRSMSSINNEGDVEYVVNVSKNTKQVVIFESDEDIEEDEVIVQKKQTAHEETVVTDVPFEETQQQNFASSSEIHFSKIVTSQSSNQFSTSSQSSSFDDVSHSSKIDSIKSSSSLTQSQSASVSQASLNELMVNWQVTKSTSETWPGTCDSLSWENSSYFTEPEDEKLIMEITRLLKVGRSVIEDTIDLKKERLVLYKKVADIQAALDSSASSIDEILQQLSSVVGDDIKKLSIFFSNDLNRILESDVSLNEENGTLDGQFLSAADSFFTLQYTRKTDLLNQIDKQLGDVVCENVSQARQIAIDKFDKLQSIMDTVLGNIDCLTLKVIDVIMSGKISVNDLSKSDSDKSTIESSYVSVKNAKVLSEIISK